jgi:hypothetical protein
MTYVCVSDTLLSLVKCQLLTLVSTILVFALVYVLCMALAVLYYLVTARK